MANRLTKLAVAALVLAGALLALAGLRPEPAGVGLSGAGFVNADRPGIDNHNSPAVAADPTRPSVVVLADRIDSPRFSCSLHISTTAGVTWRPLALALAPEAPNCFWPDVAFDANGRLLVLYTATGGRFNQPLGVWLQPFEGEAASGPAVRVAGGEAFHAHMAVDGRRVAVAYVQAPPENADRPLGFEPGAHPLMVVRSEDGGATWSAPVQVSQAPARPAHPSVLYDREGRLVVGALDYNDDDDNYAGSHEGQGGPPPPATWRVLAWTSADGGASFGASPAVVADGVEVPQRVVIDLAPGPSFATDPDGGAVYAAWEGGVGDSRGVFLSRSDDGGRSWSSPVEVAPGPGAQFLPALDVAPDGRVDIVFYDRSRDPDDVLAYPVVGSSWDNGATFVTRTASERPFDSRIGQGGQQAVTQLGNQLAVLSRDGSFLAFWADTNRPTTAAAEVHDLAVVTATPRIAGGRSWGLAIPGLAVLVAGAAIGARAVAHRPR